MTAWRWSFAAAIAIAAAYWLWHHAFALSGTPLDRYAAARAAALDTGFAVTEADLIALAGDPLALRSGAQAFAAHCAPCHAPDGSGKVGPNLTDGAWLGGGAATDVFRSIVDGRAARGMQPWGRQLGPAACKQLAAYVFTLRQHPRPGRAPEGAPWPPR